MPRKTHTKLKSSTALWSLFVASSLFAQTSNLVAQAPPAPAPPAAPGAPATPGAPAAPAAPAAPVPGVPIAPGVLNRMFSEAEAAFAAKDYKTAVSKIKELLVGLNGNREAPLELLYFNIGLGYLLDEQFAEAEAAFTDCLRRYPRGEYSSRCYLGVGRAAILQATPDKKLLAIDALKLAAVDPRYRSEAGLWLGEVYTDLDRHDEALAVFKTLIGSDIRTAQQTTAAVQVIGLLADTGKIEDLIIYLDRLINQAGVRDSIAWYSNQVIVRGDELVRAEAYESALAVYRAVPPRAQILEIQALALESMRKDQKLLEARVAAEKDKDIKLRSNASELLNSLKPAIELAEKAVTAIEEKKDLDSALLMRRGRCLFYLERHEEALVSFRTLRKKYGTAPDAKSAAYAEIVILNKLKKIEEILLLCEAYLRKYPDADNVEQVATLAGEVLVQTRKWAEVGTFYAGLEKRFPQSNNLDRYVFFQGVARFQAGDYKESIPVFAKFLKEHSSSPLVENALYYTAMSHFITNNYKETLKATKESLSRFPDGAYAGDMRYRLAFVDFNDKVTDQTDKIIKDLTSFLSTHPKDPAAGSMLCLIADSYKKKKSNLADEKAKFEKQALDYYRKAVWTESSEDVIQYALESATTILQSSQDWAGIAALHSEFLTKKPDNSMALVSASWVAKMKAREGKGAEAAEMLANALKSKIGDPSSEQVEFVLDEIVKTIVPRKKAGEIDIDAIDKQLIEILNKATAGIENATTNARLYYARSRLALLLKRNDLSDKHLKGIALINAKDPSVLSPALLAVSGDILLKEGKIDEATAMFQRLIDRYKDGNFADAGPVGLGYVALARKKPADALKIFNDALEANPGMSRFKEATLGKIEALVEVGQTDEAIKMADETVGDKLFKGDFAAKAYILQAKAYRKKAEKASIDQKLEFLKTAHAIYQRVYVAYKGFPEVCAEAYWQAYETALALGDRVLAQATLKELAESPKLKNTPRAKEAQDLVK